MKILFIGNSHTFVHYVPLRVKNFFERCKEKADITMLSIPAVGLDYHLGLSQTYFNLMYGDYDAVLLQHNAHPFPGKQSLIESGSRIASLCPEKSKVYLYMTWSEKNNPDGQKIMSEAYRELGSKINATVCPVGEIWWKIKKRYPDELYFEDGEHASVFGSSLAASVIARTLLDMPLELDELYQDAKSLEKLEYDPRMIDLVMKNGQLGME
ncbi:MAG: hypothetical protein IKF80_09890 [Erysipelotrichaceae bacterium]|nr:hypothetical protein [Erysipelotrichaceae bacterium]